MVRKRSNWLGAWSTSFVFHAIVLVIFAYVGIHNFSDMPKVNKPIELALVTTGGSGAPKAVEEAVKDLPPVEPIKPIEQKMDIPLEQPNENSIATEHKEAPPVQNAGGAKYSSDTGTGDGSGSGDGSGVGNGQGSGEGDGVDNGFKRPQILSNVRPRYPESARRNGHSGVVGVGLTISVDGTVSSAWINSSSGYSELDNAAVKAVYRWRFVPAKRGNTPIETTTSVNVQFDLSNP